MTPQDYDEMLAELAQAIFERRSRHPTIWHLGQPDAECILISLRAMIDPNNAWKWYPLDKERASCCDEFELGEDVQKHCGTLEHIKTMLLENYQGKIDQQFQWYCDILAIIISQDERVRNLIDCW